MFEPEDLRSSKTRIVKVDEEVDEADDELLETVIVIKLKLTIITDEAFVEQQ